MNAHVDPPRWTRAALARVIGDGVVARSILGDLEEEFRRRHATSPSGARAWYRREARSIAVRAALGRLATDPEWARRSHSSTESNGGDGMMMEWVIDLRRAARALTRAPGFTAVAVVTLGIAIGSNATVFSVVDGVLLEPLPWPDADRLVFVESVAPGLGYDEGFAVSPEFELQYREAGAVEELGIYQVNGGTLRMDGVAERLQMARVTPGIFRTLRASPVIGRLPTEEEMQRPAAERPALIGHGLWTTHFGRDPSVVGRTAEIFGSTRTIVGVMDEGFRFPTEEVAAWIPFQIDPAQPFVGTFLWSMIGRLAEGATPAVAEEQFAPLADRLREDYAGSARYVAFLESGQYRPRVTPLKEQLVGDVRQPLLILLGTVAAVLLIACANLANLFMVRAEARQRDGAVRAALGSGRGRLIRGHLAEAVVLALAGGALGAAVAWVGTPLLLRAAPDALPNADRIGLSLPALGFSAGLSILAALLFGLAPAVRFSAPGLVATLGQATRGATSSRGSRIARDGLVVLQTSVALVLLVGSGLLVRSARAIADVDPGFEAADVLTFQYALDAAAYPDAASAADFLTRFTTEIRALPGVEGTSAIANLPIDEEKSGTAFAIEGAQIEAGLEPMIDFTYAAPDYFETMGIEVVAGRGFTPADHESPWGAAVVSRTMAETRWPGEDPLGRRFRMAGDTTGWETVVGVVEDVRDSDLREPGTEAIFLPIAPRRPGAWTVRSPAVVVRAADPISLVPAIRERLRRLEATSPMYSIQTMDDVVSDSVVRLSFTMLALSVASLMALVLGAVGLYGVLSYVVTQRTAEIGVRMALGAATTDVRRMFVVHGSRLAALGLLVGLGAATVLTRLLQGLLYGTEALDVRTFVLMSGVMLLVSLLASYVPARRASAVDPVRSMRTE